LVVGEVSIVSGDVHRRNSAAANQSRKTSQSNQAFCAFFYFQTGTKCLSCRQRDLAVVVNFRTL
jgi:hypothetical protein